MSTATAARSWGPSSVPTAAAELDRAMWPSYPIDEQDQGRETGVENPESAILDIEIRVHLHRYVRLGTRTVGCEGCESLFREVGRKPGVQGNKGRRDNGVVESGWWGEVYFIKN